MQLSGRLTTEDNAVDVTVTLTDGPATYNSFTELENRSRVAATEEQTFFDTILDHYGNTFTDAADITDEIARLGGVRSNVEGLEGAISSAEQAYVRIFTSNEYRVWNRL